MLLFEAEQFSAVRVVIDVWMKGLAVELDDWVTSLVKKIVTDKIKSDAKKHIMLSAGGGSAGDDGLAGA